MAYSGQITGRQRALSGLGTLLILAAVGLSLASGFVLPQIRRGSEAITAISLPLLAPPREEPAPEPQSADKPSGRASAANRHARAAPVVAPKPKLPSIPPPPVAAAPNPGAGHDSTAGAAASPGPGSGAGGRGDGTGAGGAGGGSRAVWQSGVIRDRDYPEAASRANVEGVVEVRFTIQPSGRVTVCRVTRSSGDLSLDATTCRLIEERFRFRPATDAAGNPVASPYGWRQSWWLERRH